MTREIEELMIEANEAKEIKKTMLSWLKEEANGGKECFHTESCGAVSDIAKDMAELTRNCYEAAYYKTVIEAMQSKEHEPGYGGEEVYGYNHRHMTNGEFARSGHGHMVRGYRPYLDQQPYVNAYMHDPNFEYEMGKHHGSMGYDGQGSRSGSWDRFDNERMGNSSRHGETFDNYRRARRNYHDSKSLEDKKEMDNYHMIWMHDTLKNAKTMWDEADPMLKKKIKEDFGDEIAEVLEKM